MKKAKKELNLGEQLIESLTNDISTGELDDCIQELPFDNLGSITKYKYQFLCEGHILNGIIATYELGFESNDYYVKHDILQYYSIFYQIAKNLFYAMDEASKRNELKKISIAEKTISEYLKSRGLDNNNEET